MRIVRWENWVNLILGIWLIFSPSILPYDAHARGAALMQWNQLVVGLAVTVFSALALFKVKPWEEWLNFVLGAWLFFSPWVFSFPNSSILMWNNLIVGLLIAVLAGIAVQIIQQPRMAGP